MSRSRGSSKRSRPKKPYYPTEEEIAAACQRIQAGWTKSEEVKHRGILGGERACYGYQIPQGLHFVRPRVRGVDRLRLN